MIIGLDLAGVETRPTGFATLENNNINTSVLYTNEEIINHVKKHKPRLIAIDAPLSLPLGRKSINKRGPHFRICDLNLKNLGIKFFPITLGPMRVLTKRGMYLKKKLYRYKVIEVFPGATYDMFRIHRKDRKSIIDWIKGMGFKLFSKNLSQHELDAATCAITGLLFLNNKTMHLNGPDGTIIIPKMICSCNLYTLATQ